MAKHNKPLRWVRLDNAAKIYPAARRRNWSNVFRQSVTLVEDVDVHVLKSALDVTVKRFPSIAARLRRGVFWYYLQQVAEAPDITEEKSFPLSYMSKEEMRKCAFRVIAYRDRIAVEFFHSLTDGTGALIFLKTLTAEYLEQKYNISVPSQFGVLDRNESPKPEELEDCFPKNAGSVAASRKDTDAWKISGEAQADGFLHLTCFKIPVKNVLDMAHSRNCTLTVFMSTVMMQALLNLQNEQNPNVRKQKRIKLLIPVNLRQIFPSETLRNFAMYTIPEIDPRLGDFSFDDICRLIHHKMGAELTRQHMSSVIATNVNDEKNPLVRLVPLPIKNMVMKAVFDSVGEKKSCLTLSNLGQVKLPEIMKKYVRRIDFILGVQSIAPYNCGMLSYGDTMYISFIRNIKEAKLERHFFGVLQELGIPVTVESNRSCEVV
ncbi:MAG: hypothetical protein IJC91_02010 [Oscillospiraceae bacterium]|nr:hypothetical protein [Oscillospiraceae bacterium]